MNYTFERLQNMSKEEVDMAFECLKSFPCGKFNCNHCPMNYAVCFELPAGYVGCLLSDICYRKVELIKK